MGHSEHAEHEGHRILKAGSPVYGGYVIARDGKITFIRGAIPDELVAVTVEEERRDYIVASVEQVLEPSPSRRIPRCPVFGICGGCQMQFMEYGRQLLLKEEILRETFRRIGEHEVTLQPSLSGREFGYRHRGQFKVSRDGVIGFFKEGSREVVPVESCPLMIDDINEALRMIRKIPLVGLTEVHINAGDTVSVLLKGKVSDELVQSLLAEGIGGIALETADSYGKDYVTLDLHGLKYSVTPWSFFQSHWDLNRAVVESVIKALHPLENKKVLDIYAGAGNFSLPLALYAGEVVAVEENHYAVEDGRRNATLNTLRNCMFIHGSVAEVLGGKRYPKGSRRIREAQYDIVVLDPPRPGLTAEGIATILEMKPERIVYVSCNPATLARDTRKMRDVYDIASVTLVDFFPNTYHIEAVVLLSLKGQQQ